MRKTTFSLCAIGAMTAAAGAQTIDFNTLVHGEIVTNQFAPLATISAINPNRPFDIAAAFDTTLMGTSDPDLEGPPWSGGNLAISDTKVHLGMALIIAENSTGAGDGILDNPDDEASRPAGQLIFDFSSVYNTFGFDVIDIEGVVEESSSLEFYLAGGLVETIDFTEFTTLASPHYDATIVFGNNHANRVSPIDIVDGFDRVVINVGGSAAFDNIVVPAPSGVAMLGLGALLANRRRR
ncbi:MAG: PEP-CTERM sorting domain-containing protein [Phycisphaerales bacterium JB059]